MIEQEDFCTKPVNAVIFKELTKTLNKLELDALGRCADCATVHDKEKTKSDWYKIKSPNLTLCSRSK